MLVPKNQIIKGDLPQRSKGNPFKFKINKRVQGKSLLNSPLKFEDYSEMLYLGRSGDFYHFIGDNKCMLICTIIIK